MKSSSFQNVTSVMGKSVGFLNEINLRLYGYGAMNVEISQCIVRFVY